MFPLLSETQMELNWALLKNVSRFPEAQPCVKRYLTSRMKSGFFEINPQDWKAAIFLPVEDFNVNKGTVFSDSRSMI